MTNPGVDFYPTYFAHLFWMGFMDFRLHEKDVGSLTGKCCCTTIDKIPTCSQLPSLYKPIQPRWGHAAVPSRGAVGAARCGPGVGRQGAAAPSTLANRPRLGIPPPPKLQCPRLREGLGCRGRRSRGHPFPVIAARPYILLFYWFRGFPMNHCQCIPVLLPTC